MPCDIKDIENEYTIIAQVTYVQKCELYGKKDTIFT